MLLFHDSIKRVAHDCDEHVQEGDLEKECSHDEDAPEEPIVVSSEIDCLVVTQTEHVGVDYRRHGIALQVLSEDELVHNVFVIPILVLFIIRTSLLVEDVEHVGNTEYQDDQHDHEGLEVLVVESLDQKIDEECEVFE